MKWMRAFCGIVFVLAGTFKLFSIGGFAEVLRQSGAPLPAFFAVIIPATEIGGGAALLKNFQVRPVATILAVEMVFALVLVGAPGMRGARFRAGGFTIGGEAWRVPLEIALLGALVFLATQRKQN